MMRLVLIAVLAGACAGFRPRAPVRMVGDFSKPPKDWGSGSAGPSGAEGGGIFNPMVQADAQKLFKDFETLSKMQPKFFDMDLEGKKLFMKEMESFNERLVVFTRRVQLSSDPAAKELNRRLNAMALDGGMTVAGMEDRMSAFLEVMRKQIELEERQGVGAAANAAIDARNAVQGDGDVPPVNPADMAKLMEDPEAVALMSDEEVTREVSEIMRDPSKLMDYMSPGSTKNPKVKQLLVKLFAAASGDDIRNSF